MECFLEACVRGLTEVPIAAYCFAVSGVRSSQLILNRTCAALFIAMKGKLLDG